MLSLPPELIVASRPLMASAWLTQKRSDGESRWPMRATTTDSGEPRANSRATNSVRWGDSCAGSVEGRGLKWGSILKAAGTAAPHVSLEVDALWGRRGGIITGEEQVEGGDDHGACDAGLRGGGEQVVRAAAARVEPRALAHVLRLGHDDDLVHPAHEAEGRVRGVRHVRGRDTVPIVAAGVGEQRERAAARARADEEELHRGSGVRFAGWRRGAREDRWRGCGVGAGRVGMRGWWWGAWGTSNARKKIR